MQKQSGCKMSEEVVKISTLDLNEQTITLGSADNPHVTIMLGHVDAVTFDKAWKKEGWSGALSDKPDEEEIKNFNEGIRFGYGKLNKEEEKFYYGLEEKDEGAEPITIMDW